MTPPPASSVADVHASMHTALKAAMRARDPLAVAALRSGLTEAARRELTLDDVRDVLRAEVEERREAAIEIGDAGRPDRADNLRREADLLEAVLAP